MKILYFCAAWGQKNGSWDDFFQKASANGYDGVETDLPAEDEKPLFLEGLEKYNLKLIGQHWDTKDNDFSTHRYKLEKSLRALASLQPLFINSHTGRDIFSFEENCQLLTLAQEIATETGIPIIHETHRGKFSFAAHVTKPYLDVMPQLGLTFDVSHWCVVAETLLHDQTAALDLAIKHTAHIHARIGFEQCPQVTDPTLPLYSEALEFHLNCWDKIVDYQKSIGQQQFTITVEFGPAPYMPPGQPADKQWQVNLYMLNLLKKRYCRITQTAAYHNK